MESKDSVYGEGLPRSDRRTGRTTVAPRGRSAGHQQHGRPQEVAQWLVREQRVLHHLKEVRHEVWPVFNTSGATLGGRLPAEAVIGPI